MTVTHYRLPTKNKALKDITLRGVNALTERQAKNVLAFLSGHYIRANADEWKQMWAAALKSVEGQETK
jgi:hypothetical protein